MCPRLHEISQSGANASGSESAERDRFQSDHGHRIGTKNDLRSKCGPQRVLSLLKAPTDRTCDRLSDFYTQVSFPIDNRLYAQVILHRAPMEKQKCLRDKISLTRGKPQK
ncbi:protein of unknown function [Methylocaldum szegediense]|uniref:Uncharacterized protein n=1 Tax=Methylocaldum szegediense TaxID=73780 RepID=A0ABM9I9R2_9GAMM|nr:protein of unknown function [Methylocaldum szegediense]